MLGDSSYEVWTNLAQAYILLGEKESACKALTLAAKVDGRLWEVWRDLMTVNADRSNYDVVIKSYNKILTLNNRYVDEKILASLTKEIVRGVKGAREMKKESEIREKLLGLFSKILEHNEGVPEVWILYSMTTACVPDPSLDTQLDTSERLLKAHSALVSDEKWYKNLVAGTKAICSLHKLIDAYLDICKYFGPSKLTNQMLVGAKEFALEVINKIKENFSDVVSARVIRVLEKGVLELEKKTEVIQSEISKFVD